VHVPEAPVAANGLILLGFLAALFAAGVVLLRRRLGLSAGTRTIAWAVAGFAIAVLALWATSTR
jgi:hypothetical protein